MQPCNINTFKINQYFGQNERVSFPAFSRHSEQWKPEHDPTVNGIKNAFGLSTLHISPQHNIPTSIYTLEIALGGSLVRVKGKKPFINKSRQYTRGVISGFSNASRRNMMRLLASIDKEALMFKPLFVTLTYPSSWPDDPKQWKRHLDNWLKRLRRRYPDCAAIWKLEAQQRGAPHYHLLLFNIPHLCKDWLAQSWYEVVDSNDPRHRQAGTRIESIRSWNGCFAYASKAMGNPVHELPAGWERVGRMWGVSGKEHLPIRIVKIPIPRQQFNDLRDALWSVRGGQPPYWTQYDDDGVSAMIDWPTLLNKYQHIRSSRNCQFHHDPHICMMN
tara:strand:- start:2510 stop:3502 length:993 start_codon:yes stop_codon:yes gene_type:complete